MIHRTSYMEPPGFLVIKNQPPGKRSKADGAKSSINKKTNTITFCYFDEKLYRRPSTNEACVLIGKSIHGSSYSKFKNNGYYKFKSGEFIYIDENKLPEELKNKITNLELDDYKDK